MERDRGALVYRCPFTDGKMPESDHLGRVWKDYKAMWYDQNAYDQTTVLVAIIVANSICIAYLSNCIFNWLSLMHNVVYLIQVEGEFTQTINHI